MALWGGRFTQKMDPTAWALNASIQVDERMADEDVQGSIAWAHAIRQAGLISAQECEAICAGLETIQAEFASGSFELAAGDEDVHTAVERRLGELIGATAGKLHTGRSRNDQVATDFRLWILRHLPELDQALAGLQAALVEQAETGLEIVLPGYTHLQRAQPILLAHWWLAAFWPLQRDRQRLAQLAERTAVMPLGCGALAGTAFPIDRVELAKELGFAEPAPNSLDAVSDRDFAVEFLACAALIGSHLSRLAEDVILYSSAEFGYFTLSDAFSSGSSLMPQKKNPDVFELARGKAGALAGLLAGLLTSLKGLPTAYDKDLQEDKAPVFQAFDTLRLLLPVTAGALKTLTVHPERMRANLDAAMLATDLADQLVEQGVPFREAHGAVGQAVQLAEQRGVPLDQLALGDYQSIHPAFTADLYAAFDPLRSVNRRVAIGGTAQEAVKEQLEKAKRLILDFRF
ncbi:MAG TPA: argininosuccinate lyase [Anaerolineaceae bacterium]|nr:argininosuccinate lyase [Anaerolineaceae bacterium]